MIPPGISSMLECRSNFAQVERKIYIIERWSVESTEKMYRFYVNMLCIKKTSTFLRVETRYINKKKIIQFYLWKCFS